MTNELQDLQKTLSEIIHAHSIIEAQVAILVQDRQTLMDFLMDMADYAKIRRDVPLLQKCEQILVKLKDNHNAQNTSESK